jgi:hypothetical protein
MNDTTCQAGHTAPTWRCPACHETQRWIGAVQVVAKRRQDKLAREHEYGRHKRQTVQDCDSCNTVARIDANAVAGALADIFNPRPADYVPPGFRR